MKKIICVIVLSIFFLHAARAAKSDSLIVYLKNSERIVKSKDSADFFRVILTPDTNIDKDLYRVYDYYMDGKRKGVATSLTATGIPVLDGTCINYFPNGRRKFTAQFKNGHLVGDIVNYYPNGKLYDSLKVEDNNGYYNGYYQSYYEGYYRGYLDNFYNYNLKIIEFRDSTGKILATKGTGHVIIFDSDFKKVITEGDVKNSKKEGEWKGVFGDTIRFTCIFHKGEIKSGISYTKSGRQYTFKQFYTDAVFDGGADGYRLFINRNLQFPESEKRKVSGTVRVGFYVEVDGTISDVKVVHSLVRRLDEEALRVIKLSPLFTPATNYGIPVREYWTVGVNFYN